jgi:hypothetical protein
MVEIWIVQESGWNGSVMPISYWSSQAKADTERKRLLKYYHPDIFEKNPEDIALFFVTGPIPVDFLSPLPESMVSIT